MVTVVVAAFLSSGLREALEREGFSYLDARGHLHLLSPGGVIHLEGAERSSKKAETGQLGVHGVRVVQVLLAQEAAVSVSELAKQANASVGQAHRVLTLLEKQGLVRSSGRGPQKRRDVRERTLLLDWLEQQPPATRREPSLDVALYARRPEELWLKTSTKLSTAGVGHALTGAAAAGLYGVGPTSVPISLIRISPEVSLAQAAALMGAEVTERGANLALLKDTGGVGCWGAKEKDGIQVAPAVRVYLDARSARRGEDIARQFREVALGY
ncbi:helix-turn-helix domain-containing protein [Myxococcus sp. AM010]|uniref:helix-turn-helix domain-containing protein n=1 Tax=Myxococcus sp. AM010 TaxID=2745138 RepID=UPI0015963CCC|nr:helix-turn-helix domain-containing protein [Myxococcus sp. AM010]NVJ17451.1 helix-turn-helix domain-containing protein [Myxococcus sp. AM010]